MNTRDRADRWVKSMLATKGKTTLLVESYPGKYLAVVNRNEGGFLMFFANYKSKKIEPFKIFKVQNKAEELIRKEIKRRELRVVIDVG